MVLSQPPEVPAHVWALCMDARDLFGLHEWDIVVRMVDVIDGDPSTGGQACVTERYRLAEISIRRNLADSPDLRETILHEFLHIATSHYDAAAATAIALIPQRRARRVAEDLLSDGRERTVTILARALARSIKPSEETPANGDANPPDA